MAAPAGRRDKYLVIGGCADAMSSSGIDRTLAGAERVRAGVDMLFVAGVKTRVTKPGGRSATAQPCRSWGVASSVLLKQVTRQADHEEFLNAGLAAG